MTKRKPGLVKHDGVISHIKDFTWSTRARKATTVGTTGFALIAGLGGALHALPDIEPIFPAHRFYVREQSAVVRKDLLPTINSLLLWREEDKRASLDKELAGWKIGLQKEQDPQIKHQIEETIDRLTHERREVLIRIRKLGGETPPAR